MSGINIRIGDSSCADFVETHYRKEFCELELEYLDGSISGILNLLDTGRMFIAYMGDTPVGFYGFTPLLRHQESMEHILMTITLGEEKNRERDEAYYAGLVEKIGKGSVLVKYYDTIFTRGDYQVDKKDYMTDTLVVAGSFRRKGIGRALLQEVIKHATDSGATAIFSDVRHSDPIWNLVKSEGYKEIFTGGPLYSNGEPGTVFGKILTEKT
tara:strand:- start:6683 stop:7318 length:636 start_codon:yes stop_codon:yes gene_type:complete